MGPIFAFVRLRVRNGKQEILGNTSYAGHFCQPRDYHVYHFNFQDQSAHDQVSERVRWPPHAHIRAMLILSKF